MGDDSSMAMSRKERSHSIGVPTGMRVAARMHYIASAPEIRAPGNQTNVEAAKEPRFFGSASQPIMAQQTGVRCGGFQRLDWPSQHARPQQSAPEKTATGKR